jgi:hypothetical protein
MAERSDRMLVNFTDEARRAMMRLRKKLGCWTT